MPSRLPSGPAGVLDGMVFTASSRDADVQAALLRGWNQSYAQISAGEFAGSIVEAQFGDVRLFIESTSQALLQSGALPEDVVAVGVPLSMAGTAVFCGASDRAAAVHVFSGKGGFEFYSPAGLVMSGVAVSRAALFELFSDEERSLVAPRLECPHLATAGENGHAAMRDFVQGVLDLAGVSPQLVRNAPLREALRHSVLSNLAQLLLGCCADHTPVVSVARRWKIVAQARDVVLSRPDTPTNISELCLAVGVSRRTLQYCFQDVLNVSPTAFLRAMRLDGVRRLLRTADSVTDAAAHWGFWHFSYFSQDYRTLFGELPSQTHRRYRQDALAQHG
jgi:AraC family ethanolamine operon transcriptional activator